MRSRGAWIFAAVLAAGCPGKHTTPAGGPATGEPLATADAGAGEGEVGPPLDGGAAPGAGPGSGSGEPLAVVAGPITDDECGALVDKVIAIGLAEQRARDPRAPQATVEQQAAIRERLLGQLEPGCAAMSRAAYACAMAAADRAAMVACDP